METHDPNLDVNARYQRQTLLPQIGRDGQRRLAAARAIVIGCGALGSASAEQLARAGVGLIRIADRDVVELSNLQRQVLFDESEAREGLPKAIAAARRLARINGQITIEPHVTDVDADNIERLVSDVQVIIDGTDNVETRYLINDVSVKRGLPWIYGACVGTEGRVLAMRPPATACLRCIFPEPPAPGELPTCDTAGVLGPVAAVVGAMQSSAALRLLVEDGGAMEEQMIAMDLWTNGIRSVSMRDAKRADCPACGLRRFESLDAPARRTTARLCGRNAVQVRVNRTGNDFDLGQIARKLAPAGAVELNEHLLRAALDDGISLTVFADGRAIVHGTGDPARARSIYARFIGA